MNYISGVINEIDVNRFKRLIFRVSKGNSLAYTQTIEIEDAVAKNYTFE